MKQKHTIGISYFIMEGIRSIFLHAFMSFAAVGVIVACLLIMGSVSLVAINIDTMIEDIEQDNEITVFIDESLTDTQARSVGSALALDNVLDVQYISREEALEIFITSLDDDQKELFQGYADAEIIRNRFQVTLLDLALMESTIAQIEKIPGIGSVRADFQVARGLTSLRQIVQAVSVALILVLLFVSVFIIANTIKLATFDRKEEIGIMRVVGATNAFIRWPFVVQGVILGLAAASFGFFIQWGLYSWFINRILSNYQVAEIIQFVQFTPFITVAFPMALAFISVGFLVGVGGSLLTIRKFLQI
jgi:cell division transport system permease protein